jgi:Tol biopolymer transport system component
LRKILELLLIVLFSLLFNSCGLLSSKEKVQEECIIDNQGVESFNVPGKLVLSFPDTTISGNRQLFTMDTDGENLQQITFFESNEAYSPSWEPNGDQIVFSTTLNSTTVGFSLYLINSDGSNLHPLKEIEGTDWVAPGLFPTWNPTGLAIAYSLCPNCEIGNNNYDIFIYKFSSDSVEKITTHPASDNYPSWSQNGMTLTFISNRDYYTKTEDRLKSNLYQINEYELVKLSDNGLVSHWTWNPRVEKYLIKDKTKPNSYYYTDPKGKDKTSVSMCSENLDLIPISWSMNGEFLLLASYGDQGTTLYFYNTDKNKLTPPINFSGTPEFDWSFANN